MARPEAAIRDQALALGFNAVGFSDAAQSDQAKANLATFLAAGHHGDMGWMADTAERRSSPTALWPEARSVVVLGLDYGPRNDPLEALQRNDRGAVSVYAQGRDYHDVVKKRLKALARWMADSFSCQVKVFVDTAPVMEKPLAAQAGIGWQGKHTNLVSRTYGSWLFLGEVFCDLELQASDGSEDRCGSCRRCLDVCPTKAFPDAYRLDARRCLSYLTIEHKGHIPLEFRAAMGNRIYGCDDCLAVCPWNKFADSSVLPDLLPRAELLAPRLSELCQLDDPSFRRVFAGSPIKRIGRDRFVRNALIALGNSGQTAYAGIAEALLQDPSPLVRAMAIWALAQLCSARTWDRLRARFEPGERDEEVAREWRIPISPELPG